MRDVHRRQFRLGEVPVEQIRLDPKSRDDIPAVKEIMGHMMQYTTLSGLSAANLLWLNAFLVQHSIAASRRSAGIPHIPTGRALKTWTAGKQASCWRLILERNWRNVFRPAVGALEAAAAADWKTTDEAVRALAETAQIVISKQVEREISIGAELLPKLVEGRKHTAAFYTRAPSAELLAALTIRPDDTVCVNSRPKVRQSGQVVDHKM